jgi:hypothetical protein
MGFLHGNLSPLSILYYLPQCTLLSTSYLWSILESHGMEHHFTMVARLGRRFDVSGYRDARLPYGIHTVETEVTHGAASKLFQVNTHCNIFRSTFCQPSPLSMEERKSRRRRQDVLSETVPAARSCALYSVFLFVANTAILGNSINTGNQ